MARGRNVTPNLADTGEGQAPAAPTPAAPAAHTPAPRTAAPHRPAVPSRPAPAPAAPAAPSRSAPAPTSRTAAPHRLAAPVDDDDLDEFDIPKRSVGGKRFAIAAALTTALGGGYYALDNMQDDMATLTEDSPSVVVVDKAAPTGWEYRESPLSQDAAKATLKNENACAMYTVHCVDASINAGADYFDHKDGCPEPKVDDWQTNGPIQVSNYTTMDNPAAMCSNTTMNGYYSTILTEE